MVTQSVTKALHVPATRINDNPVARASWRQPLSQFGLAGLHIRKLWWPMQNHALNLQQAYALKITPPRYWRKSIVKEIKSHSTKLKPNVHAKRHVQALTRLADLVHNLSFINRSNYLYTCPPFLTSPFVPWFRSVAHLTFTCIAARPLWSVSAGEAIEAGKLPNLAQDLALIQSMGVQALCWCMGFSPQVNEQLRGKGHVPQLLPRHAHHR